MDSFPLVPLPIIPQLSFADLRKCEDGLVALLHSLSPHAADDVQLAKYAGRQLSLVQRHVEHARARERVLQLLRGDVPVSTTTIAPGVRPAFNSLEGSSASSKTTSRPIFLSPPVAAVTGQQQVTSLYSASLASPSHLSKHTSAAKPSPSLSTAEATRKKKDAIEAARALIKASKSSTTTSAFVITGGDHSSSSSAIKRRRKRTAALKLIHEEQEKAKAEQMEREREKRKQEAYQRLLARQNLQAVKKNKSKETGKRIVECSSGISGVTAGSAQGCAASQSDKCIMPADLGDATAAQEPENDRGSNDSSSESNESDVSNCSDSDEANEKAIMALEVAVQVADHVVEEDQEEDNEEDDAAAGHEEAGDENRGKEDWDNMALDRTHRLGGNGQVDTFSKQHPEVEHDEEDENENDAEALERKLGAESTAQQHIQQPQVEIPEEDRKRGQQEEQLRLENEEQDQQQQQIERELLDFISSRKAVRMEQLQQQRKLQTEFQNQQQLQSPRHSGPETVCSRLNQEACQTDACESKDEDTYTQAPNDDSARATPRVGAETVSLQYGAPVVAESTDHANTQEPIPEPSDTPQLQEMVAVPLNGDVRIPRSFSKECKDYRAYFSNFHCILTSVFEQRYASAASSSSRESLTNTPPVAAPHNDQSLRLQLKLYESWQSIMQDYATVFGGNIVTPSSMLPSPSPSTAHYRINSTTRREVSDIVIHALDKLGDWEEHPSGLGLKTTWNLLWTWSKPRVERKTLLAWQKVNHFQHAKALTRKDCLKKNMGKYLAMGGKMKAAYDVIPLTFILPQEYIAFVQAYQDKSARLANKDGSTHKNIWIMKPVALSRGRGISLVNDLSQVVYGEQVVIQEYIANPLLLDGYKFDLRLYVLVTSFNPLEAFFYDEGFVRMCTRQYEDSDLSNLFVHLTNSSIQKENQEAIKTSNNPINAAAGEEVGGTKMTLAYLWRRLEAMGADVEKVKNEIIEVILKSLMCGEDHIPFQVNSFDLYGYDILLDDTFRPWLIEINSSPSMARENELDYQVKDALILDTIKLVNPLRFDRTKFVDIVSRRLQDLENEKKRPHAHIRHPKQAEELAIRQLNEDLTEILHGEAPRNFGDMPAHLGSYRRICPHTTTYNQARFAFGSWMQSLVKLKKSCVRMERRV
uniref:Tubulin-tyrosine ligase family protein n=1 Tax=Globisporangium ultimum (strain ATCC 200006 / CBS 805.95 / DAOM BR144) TaxID=431595 RepID=K3W656_GLOUD